MDRSRAPPRCSPRCLRPPSPSRRPWSCCASPGWWVPTRGGEEIVAHNGKFGPYLKKGTDTRSLLSEEQILTVTVDEALALFAQPKTRGRAAKGPLREMGADPDTGLTMVVKDGRFGPVRDRRNHQRLLAQGRRRREPDRRAGLGAAGRTPGRRARGEEEHGQEGRPRRRRPRRPRPRRQRPRRRRPRRPRPRRRAARRRPRRRGLEPERGASEPGRDDDPPF